MKLRAVLVLFSAALILFACGKKENPNAKFVGTYKVTDTWGSSHSELGSGTLDYTITIKADGEDGLIIDNFNKTLNGVKAKVSNDSFYVSKQTAKSTAGKTYDVDEKAGTLSNGKLKIDFGYSDLDYGDLIGYIYCIIEGEKQGAAK